MFPFIERPPGGVRVNDIQSHSALEAVKDARTREIRMHAVQIRMLYR